VDRATISVAARIAPRVPFTLIILKEQHPEFTFNNADLLFVFGFIAQGPALVLMSYSPDLSMPPVGDDPVAEPRGAAGGRSSNIVISISIISVRREPPELQRSPANRNR